MPGRQVGIGFSGSTFFAIALVVAGLAGLAPALLSLTMTFAIGGAALLLLVGMAIYWLLAGGPPPSVRSSPTESEQDSHVAVAAERAVPEPASLRLGRLLFFLGAATVAQSSWRPALGLTVSEIFFIASFGCCCFAAIRGCPVARVPAALVAGVCIFVLGGAISSVNAISPTESALVVVKAIYVMLLWAWTGAMVLRDRRAILTALTLWGFSAALNGVGAIGQVAGVLEGGFHDNRALGFTDHSNDLGGGAAVALVPCLMLASRITTARPAVVAGRWLLVTLIVAGLVLSASIAAMLAAFVAVTVWLSSPAVRGAARIAVIGAIAAALLVVTVGGGVITSPTERFDQVTAAPGATSVTGSGSARLEIVKVAWPRIVADPFVGEGLGNGDLVVKIVFGVQTQDQQVHGAPLAAWYEAGIFGLIGILVVFGALMHAGWRASSGTDDEEVLIGWALVASFAAFFLYALSAPLFFHQFGWLAAVLLVAWWSRASLPRGAPTRHSG